MAPLDTIKGVAKVNEGELVDLSIESSIRDDNLHPEKGKIPMDVMDTTIKLSRIINKKLETALSETAVLEYLLKETPPVAETQSQFYNQILQLNTLNMHLKNDTLTSNTELTYVMNHRVKLLAVYADKNRTFFPLAEQELLGRYFGFMATVLPEDSTSRESYINLNSAELLTPHVNPTQRIDEFAIFNTAEPTKVTPLSGGDRTKHPSIYPQDPTDNDSSFGYQETDSILDNQLQIQLTRPNTPIVTTQSQNNLYISSELSNQLSELEKKFASHTDSIGNETTPDAFLIQRRIDQFVMEMQNTSKFKLAALIEEENAVLKYKQELIEKVKNQHGFLERVQENIDEAKPKVEKMVQNIIENMKEAETAFQKFKASLNKHKYLLYGTTALITGCIAWYNKKVLFDIVKYCSKFVIEKTAKVIKSTIKNQNTPLDNTIKGVVSTTKEILVEDVTQTAKETTKDILSTTLPTDDPVTLLKLGKITASTAMKLILKKSKILVLK